MRYVFLGTSQFSVIILERLIKANFTPAVVICNPDRPIGRKKIITQPPTKVLALKYGIKVYQPEKLEIGNWKLEINNADFAIVAAYAKILPKDIIDSFPLGIIGVHPSLLPKYRGSSPIQTVILNGDEESGVTLFLLDEKIDHGPVLANSKFQILNSKITYTELSKKLAELAADLLIETLPKFLNNKITPLPQNEAEATYTKKIKTEDAYVDLIKEEPAIIEKKVRALNPEPGVWTIWQGSSKFFDATQGKRIKILEVELIDGKLRLKKIQIEGKKPVEI